MGDNVNIAAATRSICKEKGFKYINAFGKNAKKHRTHADTHIRREIFYLLYTEYNLTLRQIADHFNVTRQYIHMSIKIYKRNTGML